MAKEKMPGLAILLAGGKKPEGEEGDHEEHDHEEGESDDSEEEEYDESDEEVAKEFLDAVKSGDAKEVLRGFRRLKEIC